MKYLYASYLVFFTFLSAINSQQNTDVTLLRYPALNPDGSMISFSYQGDIWVVPSIGGEARRLTIHEAYEHSPQWSPDGSRIVFSSNRYGNDDLFTIGADGRKLERLTYHSANDFGATYINDEEILFSTRRNYAQIERENEYYKVSVNGGTPYRIHDALGNEAAYSPNGTLMAFVKGSCRISREAYRGPANRNIWIYHAASDKYVQLTDFDGQDIAPDWGKDNVLYYLSATTGRYNIYSQAISPIGEAIGQPKQLTSYTDEGIDHFDVSKDGTQIVFSKGSDIYTMDVLTAGINKVSISVGDDYRFDPSEYNTLSNRADELVLSPNESYIAFTVNGEIFVKENNEDKPLSVSPASDDHREYNVQWLNDTTLMFISDRDGDFDLYSVKVLNGGPLFESFEWTISQITNTSSEEEYFEISPDKKHVAVVTIDGHLSIIDIDTLGAMAPPRLLMSEWAMAEGLQWSPDSKWVAYTQADLDYNDEIFIRSSDGKVPPVNVSMHPRGDYSPRWSADGSKLGFLSIRNNGDADVWFAWLNEDDWQRTQSDWDDLESDDDDKKEKVQKGDIQIDLKNIHQRLVQVTQLAGNEGDLMISHDGEEFYFSTNGGGRQGSGGDQQFVKVKWNGKDQEIVLTDGNISDLSWDGKGKNIYYIKRGGTMAKMPSDGKKSSSLPFKAKMLIDNSAIRAQIFDEAWRVLRDRFYDPNFHGQDWQVLRKQYEQRAITASTKQDFLYVFNQMLGQVNASHMGLRGDGDEETQDINTGQLGIEVKPHPQGVVVTRIVPHSPADKKQSKLHIGDIIIAVNGNTIGNKNFYNLINETVDEKIQLTLKNDTESRQVVIRPTRSISTLLYEEWVEDRKRLVEAYSDGRLGYIHIRGMNWESFENFERELMASGYGKEGVVIDVRFNGGGWTTDMVMAVLNVRQHSYTVPRGATDDLQRDHEQYKNHYPFGERLPLSAWTKPSVALCNETSYSNAEIFSHAYKTLGHGSLVGQPTFGAVISTSGRGLLDGFYVRLPFRAWYVKATGESMEHGPAVPDYIVADLPDSRANDEDPQLKKAAEVLLSQIDGQ